MCFNSRIVSNIHKKHPIVLIITNLGALTKCMDLVNVNISLVCKQFKCTDLGVLRFFLETKL